MKTLGVVASVGARTSIGLTAPQTGFLYRAGVAGMAEAPLLDPNEEPVTMCLQPTLEPLQVGPGRALKLAMAAMEEALRGLGENVARGLRVKLVVCVGGELARKRPDGVVPAAVVVSMLQKRAKELTEEVTVETCARGAAGPGFVLADNLEALGRATVDAVLIGGAHSDYDPSVVSKLSEEGRLYSPDNLDALIPGEGAAFVVLMRPDVARRHGCPAHLQIHAVATAFEKARPDNDEPAFEAIGLTVAVRKAGQELVDAKLRAGWMLTDLTFEMRRVYEWQAVLVRTQHLWCEPQKMDAPAQRIGHLGAATVPMHLALAYEAWRRGYAPHERAMSLSGSDSGERAVVLMSELRGGPSS